ncbi:hypothetical protein NKH17_12645 [Mesorhizobium sp. M1334]|uniref:hypothetical protein n=1 Tax=Mesorhizobium sp. M1334 TaxID=2957084 RepID=UPI003337AF49
MNARLNRTPPRELISVPPHSNKQLICDQWPECMCRGDCPDDTVRSPVASGILALLMIAVAMIVAGLLYVGLR